MIKFIKSNQGESGIIYCLSRKSVNELSEFLQVNGVNALPYHAGLEPKTRVKNQDMFLMEDVDVVVATIAFGMGIDGLINLRLTERFPSVKSFTMAISMIRSVPKLTPVVSRSMNANGLVSCNIGVKV